MYKFVEIYNNNYTQIYVRQRHLQDCIHSRCQGTTFQYEIKLNKLIKQIILTPMIIVVNHNSETIGICDI